MQDFDGACLQDEKKNHGPKLTIIDTKNFERHVMLSKDVMREHTQLKFKQERNCTHMCTALSTLPSCPVPLQGGDPAVTRAWQRICAASRREFQALYDRLGVVVQVGAVCV